jgi:hypothetical protein
MLLKTKDGICCDICGTTYKDQFIYYSFESSIVSVDSAVLRVVQGAKDLDVDVCEKCYTNAEDKVKQNIAKAISPNTIKCDFCTAVLRGKFNYHRMLIHRVDVDRNVEKPKVSRNYMDFNADDTCFGQFANMAMETRKAAKSKGDWS